MKHKKLLFFVATAIMTFGVLTPLMLKGARSIEADNAEYDNKLVADYNHPDVKYVAPVKKAATVSATSIKIHYHNDDGKNLTREFWVWCPNVNGSAFAYDTGSSGTDMTLTINFTGEHANFAKKKSISFIVKTKDTWVGQSENIVINYEDFPPNADGLLELWCVPGEGNAVEIYKSKAESEMARFQLATFKSWKKINIIADDVPTYYKLYALTSNYMGMGTDEQKRKLNNYLVGEGKNPTCTNVTYNSKTRKTFDITLNYTARPNVQYMIEGEFASNPGVIKTKYVSFQELYETDRFEKYYTYDGTDLGATYNGPDSTTFKVWAPTAARVRVLIYQSGTPTSVSELYTDVEGDDSYGGYNMAFRPGGVWEVTVKGRDLKNKYYNYYVVNSLGTSEATDPYAKACGVNGDRGMIVDWKETNPEGWDQVPAVWDQDTKGYDIKSPQELSVYETHVRDISMDSSWTGKKMRGTYSALVEGDTKLSDGTPTGFDHLKRLGVKAIQLEPVFDHDNNEDYGTPAEGNEYSSRRVQNWGYNPKNYNCVEGSYATDPFDGASRVKEFKQMVQAFATNGNHTRIIMDVVYNHVSSAPASCFNKLMPKYYFRYASDGTYFDGSGCGNEVKTEAPMMRKYVVDSLCWWASEYKIKGFRFDLMGLIDVGTIDEARKALYKVDPDIILYGEGWTGDGSGYSYDGEFAGSAWQVHGHEDMHDGTNNSDGRLITTEAQRKLLGCVRSSIYRYLYPVANTCFVGSFNDQGRNALRGENSAGAAGYLSGNLGDNAAQKVADMMVGYQTGFGGNPQQCVNYGSCHDNFTLYDQFRLAERTSSASMAVAATTAAECAILFSNGIAFIHGGEETFRTKIISKTEDKELAKSSDYAIRGDGKWISHNSYNLSDDVNAYRWDRLKSADGVDTTGFVKAIVDACNLRKNLTFYTLKDLDPSQGGKHPYLEGSDLNVWTNAGRSDPDESGNRWPKWDGTTAIGSYNSGAGVTCLLTSLDGTSCNGGNPKTPYLVNSNPLATISYDSGTGLVSMGGAHCLIYR